MNKDMREYTFSSESERLDKYLSRLLPNASVGFLYKMLRKKNILLNEKKATGKEVLKNGDVVSIYFSEETFLKFEGKDILEKIYEELSNIPYIDLSVIYEDEEKIIVNKPFGSLSQKSRIDDISINEVILSYLINNGLTFEEFIKYKPSIANRLDRNTGGLILATKTKGSAMKLTREIKEKLIKRRYLTVVHGKLLKDGEYKAKYIKDTKINMAKILPMESEEGDLINTRFSALKYNEIKNTSLILCELLTGKSHQIRAVAKSLGIPVINDKKYGDNKKDKILFKSLPPKLPGQYLFAKEMEFTDGLKVEAPTPEAFLEVL